MSRPFRVTISCGEPSGDLYAAALAREIRELEPDAVITGFGGERLRAAGAALVGDFEGLSVTGLTEAVRVLPRSWRHYRRLVEAAKAERPDVFVPVDFPDFNFVVARAMRRLGVPTVYYISPQLWAWRPRRMQTMKRIADRVLVIFPFEQAIYERAGVPVSFVGHPLLELSAPARTRDGFLREHGLDAGAPVIALLPGSRRNELRAILPDLVRSAALILERLPRAQFVVARAPHLTGDLFGPLDRWPAGTRPPLVLEQRTDDVLASADVAIVASGTVTVQAALHQCPMVVVYRLAPLTYRLGKPFVKVDTYAMANLVAGQRVVPELIQDAFTPAAAAAEALRVLTDPAENARVRAQLAEVRARLGEPGASRRAALEVLRAAGRTDRAFR
ncbi:MAG TPA: lipid-A-disaccharide synthase [Vicinamibacterales bacterium]|nr:lipid-A-disaccharide synthase [Vicinamibacterales bacterium]